MIDVHDEAAIRAAAQGWQDAWNRHDMTALNDQRLVLTPLR